jgi:hypothetical protein
MNRVLGWIVHKQVNVVVFAVHTNKPGFKVTANFLEDGSASFNSSAVKYTSPILGDEDRMNMQLKNAMPTVSNSTCHLA